MLRSAAADADTQLVSGLFQFRNIGLPLPGHWSTQHNGARFGTDYLSRTGQQILDGTWTPTSRNAKPVTSV